VRIPNTLLAGRCSADSGPFVGLTVSICALWVGMLLRNVAVGCCHCGMLRVDIFSISILHCQLHRQGFSTYSEHQSFELYCPVLLLGWDTAACSVAV
jgi:hypothetical protein